MKFGREEKLFASPQRRRKTKLNQAQLQQIYRYAKDEILIQHNGQDKSKQEEFKKNLNRPAGKEGENGYIEIEQVKVR